MLRLDSLENFNIKCLQRKGKLGLPFLAFYTGLHIPAPLTAW